MESINIIFAGDFIPPQTTENLYSEELKKVLQDKDFSIVNLETPLTRSTKKIKKTGNNFKRPPESIKHIKDGYWDAVALSNNHIRDYGDEGVIDTIEICKLNNILTVGAGKNLEDAAKPLRLNIKGKKICILNYSEREFNIAGENSAGANPFDLIDAYHQIKREKEESDFVIVVYHGGLEFHHVPLPGLKRNLEFLVDNGVDAVICHHTHYISGYSIFKNKPIFYGLGNFYFKYQSEKLMRNKELNKGLLVKLKFENSNKITFMLVGITKSENQFQIQNINSDQENKKFGSEIDNYVDIINIDDNLQQYWQKQYKKYRLRYYSSIKFKHPIIGKIFKKVRISSTINPSYLSRVANVIKCDAHREMIIRAFID